MYKSQIDSELEVTQVSPAYPPASGYGGGPAVCKEISTEMVHRGHSVTVCTTTANDRRTLLPKGQEAKNGVEIHRVPLINNEITYRYKLFLTKGFRSTLQDNITGDDVVHIHDLRTPLSVTAVRQASKRDIPIVLQPHGTVPRKSRLVLWKKLFDIVWGRTLFDSVHHWFALNPEEVNALRHHGIKKENISIIPNGIKLDAVPKPQSGEFKQEFNIPESKRMVLYLGRLHKSKRIDLLIEAIASLDHDAILIIAGPDDGDKLRLKKRCSQLGIKEEIRFVGRVSEEQKWKAYKDADLFVTPSFYGFPLTFLEAMSQCTPVVATSLGDSLEESEENGVFIVEGTTDDLVCCLNKLLEDTEKLGEMGKAAYRCVQDKYTWDSVVNKIEEKYREL